MFLTHREVSEVRSPLPEQLDQLLRPPALAAVFHLWQIMHDQDRMVDQTFNTPNKAESEYQI